MRRILLLTSIIFASISDSHAQDLLYLDGSGASSNLYIQSGASVYCEGGYNAKSGATGMTLNGNLYVGKTSGAYTSNWTDNMASYSVLSGSTGTVYLQSNNTQTISATTATPTFYNLYINNSSAISSANGIQLSNNVTVTNQLTLNDGLVNLNSKTLYISITSATAVTYGVSNTSTYSNSWINATYSSTNHGLERAITGLASIYDFPVGNSSKADLLQVTPASIGTLSRLSCTWETGVAGATPVTITECGTSYTQVNTYGEWHLRPANGGTLGSGSFAGGSITLRGWNMGSFPGLIDNEFAILERAEGNTTTGGWVVPSPSCTSLAPVGTSGRTVASNNALRNNLTSFDDTKSQLGIGMTIIVLPIQLLNFTAWNDQSVNQLAWSTASELNSDHFDVERSTVGSEFEKIGEVAASGLSEVETDYNFTDRYPNRGLNYYRLKLIEKDNSFDYSKTILIQLDNNNLFSAIISPNPAVSDVTIQLQSPADQHVLVQLTDVMGREILSRDWNVIAGANLTILNISTLPSAVYFINLRHMNTSGTESFKLVKGN